MSLSHEGENHFVPSLSLTLVEFGQILVRRNHHRVVQFVIDKLLRDLAEFSVNGDRVYPEFRLLTLVECSVGCANEKQVSKVSPEKRLCEILCGDPVITRPHSYIEPLVIFDEKVLQELRTA